MGKRLEELDLADEPLYYTGKITTARGRLAAFVSGLTPKCRRLLTGEGFTGWEAIEWYELTEGERQKFDTALAKYHALLQQIVNAWKRHHGQQPAVIADYEQVYTGKLDWAAVEKQVRGGAPTKALDRRLDVRRAEKFRSIAARLAPGVELRNQLHRPKNFESGDEHIQPRLRDLRYTPREVRAILENKTLTVAALVMLAATEKMGQSQIPTLRASVARGRRLLEAAGQADRAQDRSRL